MDKKKIEQVLIVHSEMINGLSHLLQEQDTAIKALNTTLKTYVGNAKPYLEEIKKLLDERS